MRKDIKKVSGQGTLEWILILFVLVGFVLMFGTTLKNRIGGLVGKMFDTVESNAAQMALPK